MDNTNVTGMPEGNGNNDKRDDMMRKIIFGMAVVIGILVIVVVALLLTRRNDNSSTNPTTSGNVATSGNQQSSTTADVEEDTSKTDNEKETGTSSKGETSDAKEVFDVAYESSNSWENGEAYFNQFDLVITNKTSDEISSWEVVVDVEEGTKVNSFWNCNAKIENGKLYLDAKGFYSEVIVANGTVEGMGVIIESTVKEPLKDTYSQNITVNTESESEQATEMPSESEKETESESEKETEKETQGTTVSKPADAPGSAVANHGQLSVSGTQLVDKNGEPYRLCGVSTHGLQWFPQYVTKESFKYLRDDWGANVVRLALYVEEGGYLQGDKAALEKLIYDGVDYATELGMYVIIDWHILNGNTREPLNYKSEAIEFFTKMAKKYAGYENVIYEICNEPNGTSWANNIKPYADEVVAEIRKYDKDAIILVGTNTWSQDVDDVIGNRVKNDENVMYVAHFYAATHTDNIRNKVQKALDAGIPIFVSECSICDASGNGNVDYDQAEKWFSLLANNNVSYVCWNFCNKNETSALISSSVSSDKVSGFSESELSVTGVWFRNRIRKDLGLE